MAKAKKDAPVTVLKSKDGKPYGGALSPDELRGPVGDALRKSIEEDAQGDGTGIVDIDGHQFAWFTGPQK